LETVILKGALTFAVWRVPSMRPTKDIDLLGRMNNSIEAILSLIRDLCNQDVEPDGRAALTAPGVVATQNLNAACPGRPAATAWGIAYFV
jgi:hypothetical protein